jgi:hypothetical protein
MAAERPLNEPTIQIGVPDTYQGFIQHSIESYRGKLTEYVV